MVSLRSAFAESFVHSFSPSFRKQVAETQLFGWELSSPLSISLYLFHRRTQPMRSRVVGPALSHRGLFSSHPPPISFLPSVFFLLRMMRSFIVLFLGFDPIRSLVGLPWWFNTMLPAFPACTLVRNRSELRAKRLQTATRQYLARQYPSGGALSFLLLLSFFFLFFPLPLPLSSSSFVLPGVLLL